MSVVVMGYHNMGCIGIRMLIKHNIPVSAVFTYRDDPNENIWFESLAEVAKGFGIDVYYSEDFSTGKLTDEIIKLNPDVIFSFYYRDILPKDIIDIPRYGAVNLHGSLLPKYRGRCPVNWQIINGEEESGVTLHYITEKVDDGDIIAQRKISISNTDTALDLFNKLKIEAEILLDENIDEIVTGKANRTPQDNSKATIFSGRRPEDGKIDWSWDTKKIYDLIRGVTKPYPGAFCFMDDEKVIIWRARISDIDISKNISVGQIIYDNEKLYVKANNGVIELIEYEVEENKELTAGTILS